MKNKIGFNLKDNWNRLVKLTHKGIHATKVEKEEISERINIHNWLSR